MTEFLQEGGVWLLTGALLIAGLVGCVVPILPGHIIILLGVISYRLIVGPAAGIPWWSWVILVGLMAVSQTFEILSGSLGAKWFGGSKWGAIGALVGGIVGLFFFPVGLLLGPLVGAFGFELAFAKKGTRPAAISGVGSVVGTVAGMGFKIGIGLLMIAWFLADVLVIT